MRARCAAHASFGLAFTMWVGLAVAAGGRAEVSRSPQRVSASRTHVGRLEGSPALIALVSDRARVLAHVVGPLPDGTGRAAWFFGDRAAGEIPLLRDAGSSPAARSPRVVSLHAMDSERARGTVTLHDGRVVGWEASAVPAGGAAGLHVDVGSSTVTSLIVTNDGRARGAHVDERLGRIRRVEPIGDAAAGPRWRVRVPASSRAEPGVVTEALRVTTPAIAGRLLGDGRWPPSSSADRLEVKFLEGCSVEIVRGAPRLSDAGPVGPVGVDASARRRGLRGHGTWARLLSVDAAVVERLQQRARSSTRRELRDLNLYYTLTPAPDADVDELLRELNALPEVEFALRMPRPAPPPEPPDYSLPGDFDGDGSNDTYQQYLDGGEVGGIDARHAWSVPGGTGVGVTLCDVEYDSNIEHADFEGLVDRIGPDPVIGDVIDANIPAVQGVDIDALVAGYRSHGTNVLGLLASQDNGYGTTGVAREASVLTTTVLTAAGYSVASPIVLATVFLGPGDVILVEQQTQGPNYELDPWALGRQRGLVPAEWDPAVHDAILLATTLGITVVEAAGNGSQDLDASEYETLLGAVPWAPFAWDDSGAIIVGGGASPLSGEPARSRRGGSNHGSRVDLQGWGDGIVTTGGQDANNANLWDQEGVNLRYRTGFGGTSGASAMVAGAAASIQGIHRARFGVPLAPGALRALLARTGRPQARRPDNPAPAPLQRIGPLPELRAAANALLGIVEPPVITPPGGQGLFAPVPLRIDFGPATYPSTAAIRYTLDGSEPTWTSPEFVPGSVVAITDATGVRARTYMRMEFDPETGERRHSSEVTALFLLAEAGVGSVGFDPPPDTYAGSVAVSLEAILPDEGGLDDPIILYNVNREVDPVYDWEVAQPYWGEPLELAFGEGPVDDEEGFFGSPDPREDGPGEVWTIRARLYGVNAAGEATFGRVATAAYVLTE